MALFGVGAISLPQLSIANIDSLDKVDHISVTVGTSNSMTPVIFNNGRSQAEIRVKFHLIPGMSLTADELDDLGRRLTIHNKSRANVQEGSATDDDIASNRNQFYIQEIENNFDPVPVAGGGNSKFAAAGVKHGARDTVYRYITSTGVSQDDMEVCAMVDSGKSYGGTEFNTCNDENTPKIKVRQSFQYSSNDLSVEKKDIQRRDGLSYRVYQIRIRNNQFPNAKIVDARIIGNVSQASKLPEGIMLRGAFKVQSGQKVDGSAGGDKAANYLMRPLHLYENEPEANYGIRPAMAGCWIPEPGNKAYYSTIDSKINWATRPVRLPRPRGNVKDEPIWSENILPANTLSSGSLNCVRFEVGSESMETKRKMPLTVNYPLPFNGGKLVIHDNYGNEINGSIFSNGWDLGLSI